MTEDRSDQLAQETPRKKWKVDYLYHKQNDEISRIMSLKSKNFKQLKNLERGVIIFSDNTGIVCQAYLKNNEQEATM